jgi:hypothetical protein
MRTQIHPGFPEVKEYFQVDEMNREMKIFAINY